jgi:hypothetical protein
MTPRLLRAKGVKRPWICMKLGVVGYQNCFGTRCGADAIAIARQRTSEALGKRSEMGPVHHPERDSRTTVCAP